TREMHYRLDALPGNVRTLQAVLVIAAIFHLVNLPGDFGAAGNPTALRILVGTRLAGSLLSLIAIAMLRNVRSPDRFDRIGTAWGIATALVVVTSFASLPPYYLAHGAWSSL